MPRKLPMPLHIPESSSISTSAPTVSSAHKRCLSTMESTTDATHPSCAKKQRDSPQDKPDDKDANAAPLSASESDTTKPPLLTQLTNTEVLDVDAAPLATSSSDSKKPPLLTQLTNTEVLDVDAAPLFLFTGSSDSMKPPVSTQPISPDASKPKSGSPLMLPNKPDRSSPLHHNYRGRFNNPEFWQPSASLITKEEQARWDDARIFGYEATHKRIIASFTETLNQAVGLFSDACLPAECQVQSSESLDTETQNRIKAWAPKAELYLGHQCGGHKLLMDAYVWRVLFDNLFSEDCHDKWAGQRWADYGKARRGFQERVPNEDSTFTHSFHAWRYHHVRMLYATHGPHSDPARLDTIVRNELGPLIELGGASPDTIDEYLARLVNCAIDIDFRAHALKGAVSFEMREPETRKLSGFAYKCDPNVMVCYYEIDCDDGLPVHFVTRPRLQIYGLDICVVPVNKVHYSELFFDDYDKRTVVPMQVAVGMFKAEDGEV